jgi:biofilm PGA synthesis lipoprotein PgaB
VATLIRLLLIVSCALVSPPGAAADGKSRLVALSYHDVVVDAAAAAGADATAVTVDTLVQHFSWLDAHGYTPITLDAWHAAAAGGSLPEKPVLLTFDDGYTSFHRHVLPLLELFDYPAVLAPVTSWIEAPPGSQVAYGDELVPRSRFLTWAQIREAQASGLVEVATHSHDLHRGIPGNPWGNLQPAAVTRRYETATGRYEPEAEYLARVRRDLARSVQIIEQQTGVRPRTVVWPYGAYEGAATAIARSLGLERSLTLGSLPNSPLQHDVHRRLVGSDMSLDGFVRTVRDLYPQRPLRAAHVDLDYVYDPDPAQQGRNLDRLLDRIKAMRISHVFLQAFADPDGDGVADAVYFPNRHMPVRADLFNRVAWQLRTRAGVAVFAWMPVMSFALPDAALNRELAVRSVDGSHATRYHRLSPFHPEARRLIAEIYADLGRFSHFRGVLFHDDGFLTDREDASAAARRFYAQHWPELVGLDPLSDRRSDAFARAKTRYLIDFTTELADVLRQFQPELDTARNLYARPVLAADSERWFAQNLRLFMDHYDYTAIMAMPWLENARAPRRWLERLVDVVKARPRGLERVVFELQTRDWETARALPDRLMHEQLDVLLDAGVRHIAWYPDDFIANHPSLELLRATVSLADHPAVLE